MQQKVNRHPRELCLEIGDMVWVKLQPCRQSSVAHRSSNKLARKYFGPLPMSEKIGSVIYWLALPNDSKIHPVFHVSKLKAFHGEEHLHPLPLPLEAVDGKSISTPIAICGVQTVMKQHKVDHQVLVQWSDTTLEEATGESTIDLHQRFPDFHLEDKVVLRGRRVLRMI